MLIFSTKLLLFPLCYVSFFFVVVCFKFHFLFRFKEVQPTHGRFDDKSVKKKSRNGESPRCAAARSAVFSFLVSPWWCHHRGAEHSCADIVIKSTTARVSSPHSPLICQPCSDGRLCKYMQNRWIRPLHTLPPNFRLFHTLRVSPP